MGSIEIIHDPEGVYEEGSIHDVGEIIKDFSDVCTNKKIVDYLWRIPIPDAIDYICKEWSISYRFV